MFVDGEMLVGAVHYQVRKSSIGIWDDTRDVATEQEKQRVIDNIEALFRKNGMVVEFF